MGTLFGDAQLKAPYEFVSTKNLTEAGVYHFWLTYDISSSALADEVVEASLAGLRCNGQDILLNQNVTASASIVKGKSGVFRIGNSKEADYSTIQSALVSLTDGVEGPVVYEIENGTYTGAVVMPEIKGASATNTITFKSLSGNYAVVVFESSDVTSDDNGMFTINGTDYFVLDGVTLKTEAAWPSLIKITNVSRHVTIRNCYLQAPMSSAYTGGTKLLQTVAMNEANKNNDYVTIESNLFEGGTQGVYINGTGYLVLPKQTGAIVKNNVFKNQGRPSIYITQENEALVENNRIENTQSTVSNFCAIDVVSMPGTIVRNNSILLATKSYASGIYLRKRPSNVTTNERTYVYNNEIVFADLNGSSLSYGINCTDELAYTDIDYNSILINRKDGTGNGSGIYFYASATLIPKDVTFRNNLIQNLSGGTVCYLKNASALGAGKIVSSNNVLYTNGSVFAYAGSNLADIAAWKEALADDTSICNEVPFVSSELLMPNNASGIQIAQPLTFVNSDINGNTRPAENPTVGAYEYLESMSVPAFADGYPQVTDLTSEGCTLQLKTDNDAVVYYLVQDISANVPDQKTVLAADSQLVRRGITSAVEIRGLSASTSYKIYLVLQNLKGVNSDVVSTDVFETSYIPTAVSDFEHVTIDENGDFEDGTAAFSGLTVETVTDGVGEENKKAAKIEGAAVVSLTNSSKGLTLDGFYLKSDAPVSVEIYLADNLKKNFELPATGIWKYINLREYGDLTSLVLMTEGNAWIDNFSGMPQPLVVAIEDLQAKESETVTWVPYIEGGVEPYHSIWMNAAKDTLSTDHEFAFKPKHTGEYTVVVTDAWGNSQRASALITVEGKSYVGTFEDLYLDPESHWCGQSGTDESVVNSKFYTGSYAFNNSYTPAWDSWALWGYTNETSTQYASYKDQFHSVVGSGVNGSANYGVAYVSSYSGINSLYITNAAQGDSIKGCYITNTAWVEDAILHGDGMSTVSGGFAQGDSLTIVAIGKNGIEETGRIYFYLADYRDENSANHYYLDSWQWLDLRPLGKVTEVVFEMTGSKRNSWGLTTPTYFCIDDINGERNETKSSPVSMEIGNSVLSMSDYFGSLDKASADIHYQIVDRYDESVVKVVSVGDNLTLQGVAPGKTDIVVRGEQCGKQLFVRIPLEVRTEVSASQIELSSASIRYAASKLLVSTALCDYQLELISSAGVYSLLGSHLEGDVQIELSGVPAGVYMVRICSAEGSKVEKIIVR